MTVTNCRLGQSLTVYRVLLRLLDCSVCLAKTMDETGETERLPHSQIVKSWWGGLELQCPGLLWPVYCHTVTLFALAAAWKSQCDSHFIEA